MHLAIINTQTNIVVNIIVPPTGAQAYFVGNGYIGIESETAAIGDTYENGVFVKPITENNNQPTTE